MNRATHFLLGAALVFAPSTFFGQSTSPASPQDVPKHQPPGTNSPDISKQRRPAPDTPSGSPPQQNSPDVPNQQPGTDNPDVAKQRPADKTAPARGATDSEAGKAGKNSKKKKSKTKKSDTATIR